MNTWNNITLGEFEAIRKVVASDVEQTDKMISIAAMLQGITEEELCKMPLEEAQEVFALTRGLENEPKPSKIRKQYSVGSWRLDVADMGKLSVAQWIDFQNFYRAGMEEHMTDILSVALVPHGKQYNEGYDIEGLRREIRDKMLVPDALAVCFSFQRKFLKSTRRTLNCLVALMTLRGKMKEARRARLLKWQASDMLHSL